MTVRIQERVATDSRDVLTNSVSSKSCSCCFVAQASKPEPKLPAGDFHGGVGRRRVLWSVCPSPPLAERVPVVLTTHACETESHAALPLYHLPPWSTLSNTYGFSGYMGASCSLRNDQEYPLPVLPFLSAHFVSRVPTPLRSEDSRYGVWGMDRE